MRRYMVVLLVSLVSYLGPSAGLARAESPIAPPVKPLQNNSQQATVLNSNSKVDDVLDALQADGKNVKSFTADVKIDEFNTTFQTDALRFGKVWFESKPNGDPVLHLLMDHKEIAKKQTPEKREYLIEDGWLTDRNYDVKKEVRMQLVPAGQKVNLFQLGKGPFPLPIGQDRKDVKAEFAVSILAPDKDDPAGTIHLKLVPLPNSQWAQTFVEVEVWVDLKSNMPVRIFTKDKSTEKTVDLLNLGVNSSINPKELALPPLEKGWDSLDKPLK
jgi:outer membrane lipoprotein-sorting protein